MKSKTDTSKGLNTSTGTKQTYKQANGKTRVGNAISTIWGGFKGIFTGKGPVQTAPDGKAVIVKDANGNVIAGKQVNNTNWQNILAGVGLLVGGITGATSNEGTTQQEYEIQNQQEIRTGSNTLLIVGIAIVVFIGGIIAYFKMKD